MILSRAFPLAHRRPLSPNDVCVRLERREASRRTLGARFSYGEPEVTGTVMNVVNDRYAAALSPSFPEEIEAVVSRSAAALMARQQADGHWVFPLEADATIPAEYVLY
ncbi:hypothetical protein, partial [Telmatospirillum siberiense]|uniref:hypothetical protein n=1 Tax=Telmatospirillum siberiense TaxID=382514 RepID=UPI003B834D65